MAKRISIREYLINENSACFAMSHYKLRKRYLYLVLVCTRVGVHTLYRLIRSVLTIYKAIIAIILGIIYDFQLRRLGINFCDHFVNCSVVAAMMLNFANIIMPFSGDRL